MPRVLRIINRLNLGGPTFNASYLSRYLPDQYETLLVAGMKDATEASSDFIPLSMGLEPHYVKHMHREINPLKDRKAYKEMKGIIKDFRPDIVHTHAAKAGALGRLAAANCKVPVIVHTFHGHVFHSYFNPVKTRAFVKIEQYLASKSSKIIAISNKQKKEIGEDFGVAPLDKIEVIPLGFDLSRFQENIDLKRKKFREEWGIEDEEVAIGIIGRLVPIKNHQFFLEAIQSLSEKTNIPFKAFIIGDGEDRAVIENKARELGLIDSEKIIFTSWIKDVDEANAGMDIIALTSFNEGTPVSLIEAQAANKPIVSTNVGGIQDIILENDTGFLSELNEQEKFVSDLQKLVEDADLRKRMGQQGFDHVKEKFSYQRLVNDMDRLYTKLLKGDT